MIQTGNMRNLGWRQENEKPLKSSPQNRTRGMQEQPLNKHGDTVFCFKFAEKIGPWLENSDRWIFLSDKQTSLQMNNYRVVFQHPKAYIFLFIKLTLISPIATAIVLNSLIP